MAGAPGGVTNEGHISSPSARMEPEAESSHPDSLEAQTPMVITQILSSLITIVTSYGWPCLFLGVLCGLLWSRYAPAVRAWRKKREEQEEAALHHKNPELVLRREAALESARLRMQEKYEAASREHAQKQQIREEERRLQKLEAREAQLRGEGRSPRQQPDVPAAPTTNAPKRRPVFRQEYNPLLGSGPASGYRPPRRGGAAGGG